MLSLEYIQEKFLPLVLFGTGDFLFPLIRKVKETEYLSFIPYEDRVKLEEAIQLKLFGYDGESIIEILGLDKKLKEKEEEILVSEHSVVQTISHSLKLYIVSEYIGIFLGLGNFEKKLKQVEQILKDFLTDYTFEYDFGEEVYNWESFIERISKALLRKKSRNVFTVKTNIPVLDEYFLRDGQGLQSGRYYIILGITGGGKTTFLCRQAIESLYQGKNVLFLNLEEPIWELQSRLDSYVFMCPRYELKDKDKLRQHLKTSMERFPRKGKLIIKSYKRKVTFEVIEQYIRKLIVKKFKPEVILVDYLDLLRSGKRYEHERFRYRENSEFLKQLAMVTNSVVISPTQFNRDALKSSTPGMGDISEAWGKIFCCDCLLCFFERKGRQYISIEKNRQGPKGKLTIDFDLATGIITNDELVVETGEKVIEEDFGEDIDEF